MSLLSAITKAVTSAAASSTKTVAVQSSAETLSTAQEVELSVISALLEPAGIATDNVTAFQEPQLDRAAAATTAQQEMSAAISKNDTEAVAETARLIHEASRVRRDVNIAKASHKQLLLGSYKTLYQRKLQLENNLREGIYA